MSSIDIAPKVRTALMNRAAYKCEKCRIRQRALVCLNASGELVEIDSFAAYYEREQGNKVYVVYLRVVALDGNRNNQALDNLQVLCPRCCNQR